MPRSSSVLTFVDVPIFADFRSVDARFGGCPPILPILVAILDFGPAVAECDDSVEDKATRAMIYGISAEVA